MNFDTPERLRGLLSAVRDFVAAEIMPLEASVLAAPFTQAVPRLAKVREQLMARGWWSPPMPSELGGMGLDFREHALVSEELGKSPLGHYAFNCQAPDAGNMEILKDFGTSAQKARWLVPLVRGDIRSCFAMTEPDRPGANPTWLATTAAPTGGGYVLNGRKWFATAADGAAFAIVMAVTDPAAEPHRRASLLIVPSDTPGYRLVRNVPVMGHAGDGWLSHGELRFEDCRVPRENLLGEEGQGFAIAQARLGPGRIHHCMRWIGVCERSLDLLCRRAATRQIAPGELLGTKQTVQNWIAESRAEIDAARLLVLHAAWRIDRVGTRGARVDISLIKFHVARVMQEVIDRAVQVHGALGVSDDTVLSWFYRHERGARIYDGPDEVHKTVVARQILKTYEAGS